MDSEYSKVKQEDFYSPTFTFEPPEEVRELTLRDPSINGNDDRNQYPRGKIPVFPSQQTDLDSQNRYHIPPTQSTETGRGLEHRRSNMFQVSLSELTKSPWVSTGSFYEPKSTERRRIARKGSQPELTSDRMLSSRRSAAQRSPEKQSSMLEKRQMMKNRRENRSVSSMSDFFRTHSGQGSRHGSISMSKESTILMDTMKSELDELKIKLKEKEIQLQDNLSFIENIQGSLKAGGKSVFSENDREDSGKYMDFKTIQNMHIKARQLEKENEELRDTLRNEVLASERQRSELDMVKEVLNERLSNIPTGPRSKLDNAVEILMEHDTLINRLEKIEAERSQLVEKVTGYQSRIFLLEEENAKLNKSLKDANNDRQKLREDIDNSIKALKAAREEAKLLEEDKTAIMNFVNNEVLQERNSFKIENEKLGEENKSLLEQINKLKFQMEEKNIQIDILERERQTMIETQQETTMRQVTQKEGIAKDLEKEINFLKSEKEQLNHENEALRLQLATYEDARAEFLAKERAYQTEIQNLKAKIQNFEHEKEYELYQNDIIEKEQKELYEKRIQEVLKDRSNLQAQLQNLEYENKKLVSQKDEVVNKMNRFQTRIKELEEQNNTLQNLRKDELHTCQDLVATRDKEIASLKAENSRIKADVDKAKDSMSSSVQELRTDLEKKMKEADNYRQANIELQKEIEELKETNKTLVQNLNYQASIKQLEMINSSQKDIDINMLKEENEELKTEVSEFNEKSQKMLRDINTLKQKAAALEQSNQTLHKEMELMAEDNDRLETEGKKAKEELTNLKNKDNYFRSAVQEILNILSSFVQALNKNASTASNFLSNCTPKLKEMLTISYLKLATENLGKDLDKAAEYLQEWFVLMLEEIEKDVLKVFKLKEEVKLANQEIEDLKNKLGEIGRLEHALKEANQECNELKQEKFELQQKLFSFEKNETKLKKEIHAYREKTDEITSTLEDLHNVNAFLKHTLDENKRDSLATKAQIETETMLNKTLESHYDLVLKEKKHLEELLDTIVRSIPNPDHAKLIKDIIDLQFDIIKLERSSAELEDSLIEREAELKALSKKSSKPTIELTEARKEVERLRNEFQNSQSQLTIFMKRKSLLREELSHLERTEKRRFEYGLEVEKSIAKYRDDYNDLKSRYEDLLHINSNLQARVKELMEGNFLLQTEPHMVRPPKMVLGTNQDHLLTMNERMHSHLTTGLDDDLNNKYTKSGSSVLQGSPRGTSEKKGRRSVVANSADLNPLLARETDLEEKQRINNVNVTKIRLRDKLNEARNVIRHARDDDY